MIHCLMFTFTFGAFSFCPERLTSTFVRRKCNSKPLSVEEGLHKNEFQAHLIANRLLEYKGDKCENTERRISK